MKSESRRKGRMQAFQVLYGLEFQPGADARSLELHYRSSPDPAFEDDPEKEPSLGELHAAKGTPVGFGWELASGVWNKREELDEVIKRFSQHWRIDRIAKTELTILRIAIYEMLHRSDVPVKVAINEAVELAKQFGDENSRGFVNGILDAAARALENGTIGAS